ncbi:MAG: hypothetical protein QNJ06_02755 [Kiloniellales bacterium]|nr:hypothetical protein [Kiloniellales bacterium]MDJ0968794.1 hypothetical protein [Kiloniellales bacterium]MDJ0982280.1 hypothetical protein [Kiloniellales bacterium]
MEGIGSWIVGGFVGLLGLAALVLAGNSHDSVVQYSALGVVLLSIVFIMMLIKIAYEREHGDR